MTATHEQSYSIRKAANEASILAYLSDGAKAAHVDPIRGHTL